MIVKPSKLYLFFFLLHKTHNVSHTQPYTKSNSINERERKKRERKKFVTLNFPFISIFSHHTQYFTTFKQSNKKTELLIGAKGSIFFCKRAKHLDIN